MKNKAFLLAFLLLLLTAGLVAYRVIRLNYPLLPNPQVKAWQLRMGIRIQPEHPDTPMKIQIGIPQNGVNQAITDERINSGPLDATLFSDAGNHMVVWSGMINTEEDYLHYDATIVIRQKPIPLKTPPEVPPIPESLTGDDRKLVQRLADGYRTFKAPDRLRVIADSVRGIWEKRPPPAADRSAWSAFVEKHGRKNGASFPAACGRPSGPRYRRAFAYGRHCFGNDPLDRGVDGPRLGAGESGHGPAYPASEQTLPLVTGGLPLIRADQAKVTEIRWTLNRQIISPWRMHMEPVIHGDHFLNRWSLFSLPQEFQTTFRIILLVPIGALMICFLRNVVGFPSFGIFMPVLMALAFRTTGLLYGLLIFAGVVLIGYAIRRRIDELRLLLVPRLSAILTLVIFCFTVLAVMGNKLDLRHMMAVGLLPFVILTMTVERFYVLIEESGVREALLTSAGSAAVAMLTYWIINIERLQLMFFIYPELLFTVAACQILLGRYTGYRLSEYIRFRALRDPL